MAEAKNIKFIELNKQIDKLRKALRKIYKPILKNVKPNCYQRKQFEEFKTEYLNNPDNIYWKEQSVEFNMKPHELFNKVLSRTYSLNDKDFSEEIDNLIIKSVSEGKRWLEIGLTVSKHPLLCIKRYIKLNKKKKINWSQKEDDLLLKAVESYGSKDWQQISSTLENKTIQQCRDRYKKIAIVYKKGKWTKKEDEMLKEAYKKYSDKGWILISTYVPNRSDVQCRERWLNTLKPGIKLGKWTELEDSRLLKIIEEFGFKWSIVAEYMRTRTDSQCRRRWLLLNQKKNLI